VLLIIYPAAIVNFVDGKSRVIEGELLEILFATPTGDVFTRVKVARDDLLQVWELGEQDA
jgi:hypothetical protein